MRYAVHRASCQKQAALLDIDSVRTLTLPVRRSGIIVAMPSLEIAFDRIRVGIRRQYQRPVLGTFLPVRQESLIIQKRLKMDFLADLGAFIDALIGLNTKPQALTLGQVTIRAVLIYLAGFVLLRFEEHRFMGKKYGVRRGAGLCLRLAAEPRHQRKRAVLVNDHRRRDPTKSALGICHGRL